MMTLPNCSRLTLCALLALSCLAGAPALAGGGGGGGGGDAKSGPSNRIAAKFELIDDGKPDAPQAVSEAGPRAVDLPMTVAPVFEDGWLEGYLFLSVRLTVSDGTDVWKVRERVHKVRDAIIRRAHVTSMGRAGFEPELNPEVAEQLVADACVDVLGEGQIARIEFVSVGARS